MRFRKTVNAGPFRMTFSKSGVGCSFGFPGWRYTITANGRRRTTYSLPGTGVSYVKESSGRKNNTTEPSEQLTGEDWQSVFVCTCIVLGLASVVSLIV